MVKIGVIKCGNIGISPVLDLLFDEIAEREDITFRVVGSGPKLTPEHCEEATKLMLDIKPDLIMFTSPNTSLPGPKKSRDMIQTAGIPAIYFSDHPGKKAKEVKEEIAGRGMGYFIIKPDSMIGAKRPFLDPVEMCLYNSDVLRVLAICGVVNLIVDIVDKVIDQLKAGSKPELPQIVINRNKALKAARFSNQYAKCKASAALDAAERVSGISVEGCFMVKGRENYLPVVGSAHELMRMAAKLADEAREIEKANDSVLRRPHAKDGKLLEKREFLAKPV
ncbi:MAG: F420-dependent methylenetetrahydromethanopterin dehydrogenase [Candidatus Helarchaeota archaeon]|nr:F420-dependent methylenetetrahydromethanopterin dehydrogenase [Candidatus Helarchaeota archaeon]